MLLGGGMRAVKLETAWKVVRTEGRKGAFQEDEGRGIKMKQKKNPEYMRVLQKVK
jgi:hypothetical protein